MRAAAGIIVVAHTSKAPGRWAMGVLTMAWSVPRSAKLVEVFDGLWRGYGMRHLGRGMRPAGIVPSGVTSISLSVVFSISA